MKKVAEKNAVEVVGKKVSKDRKNVHDYLYKGMVSMI